MAVLILFDIFAPYKTAPRVPVNRSGWGCVIKQRPLMNLLRDVLTARRPSRIKDMPAKVSTFLCREGFAGITFFGRIYTDSQEVADALNHGHPVMKNHEMIHLRQAQDTGDSWLIFYLLYLMQWLRGICLDRRGRRLAYYLNPFEMEAYINERDMHYPGAAEAGAAGWREYRRMTFPERYKLMRKGGKIPDLRNKCTSNKT